METLSRPKILCIANETGTLDHFKKITDKCELEMIGSSADFYAHFEAWQDGMYLEAIIGGDCGLELANEAAQILATQCPSTPAIYVTAKKENLSQKSLQKNGIDRIFLLPLDSSGLNEYLSERLLNFGDVRVFKSVRILDLAAETKLDFATFVYLPMNKKFVRYGRPNEALPIEKIEKLGKHNFSKLHIEQQDMDKFYKYTAANLKKGGRGVSETEREAKVIEVVRQFLLDLFDPSTNVDFATGKEMVANSQKIVSNFVTGGTSSNWYNDLIRAIGGATGGFSHAAQVSTYAFLFALAVRHERPEDLAMAGFLHDVGMVDAPEGLEARPRNTWSAEELKSFENHPQESVNQIKQKKMIITPEVERAILQHHESHNGKGFPKRLPGVKICLEAQILSLADQFDDLTRVEEGKKRNSPLEALEVIRQNRSVASELITKIVGLFPTANAATKAS